MIPGAGSDDESYEALLSTVPSCRKRAVMRKRTYVDWMLAAATYDVDRAFSIVAEDLAPQLVISGDQPATGDDVDVQVELSGGNFAAELILHLLRTRIISHDPRGFVSTRTRVDFPSHRRGMHAQRRLCVCVSCRSVGWSGNVPQECSSVSLARIVCHTLPCARSAPHACMHYPPIIVAQDKRCIVMSL